MFQDIYDDQPFSTATPTTEVAGDYGFYVKLDLALDRLAERSGAVGTD